MSDDAVTMGREAWSKINRATDFAAWKSICLALSIGREHAFRTSGANAPHGTRYSKAFNLWIEANGFGNMAFGIRCACLQLADNLEAIEQWRNDLSAEARQAQNHPQVILRNWRKGHRQGVAAAATGKGRKRRRPEALRWQSPGRF